VDPAPHRPYETTWEDWVLGGGALAQFADPRLPLRVEIGPGEDDFLLDSARDRPDRNWLGIEYSRKRVARYLRRVHRVSPGIPNLRLIWRPAADLVGAFLAPELVEAYHIHFPDPWPKAHHGRYRMLHPVFVRDLEESLVPGGSVHLATDSPEYALEIVEAFAQAPGLENLRSAPGYEVAPPGERATVFERRWREMGREILRIDFRRRPVEVTPPRGIPA
jgi:tRNA (guanine-N7-)-methyltransferase